MQSLTDYRFGIGPISKNAVDACINYANESGRPVSLIASRNQVDWQGGYVNNWTTSTFAAYVEGKSDRILLARDHGGPRQGFLLDDGLDSLTHDCLSFDLIHLDPWKAATDFTEGCYLTETLLRHCVAVNPAILFEIGTEEAIFPYSPEQLDSLVVFLKGRLPAAFFERIVFAVVQGGTSLHGNTNTGHYDASRLEAMTSVCAKHGLKSKAHNGDYLSNIQISDQFKRGLDALNIAPEFGQIETKIYLSEITDWHVFNDFYQICLDSRRWVRWLGPKPPADKRALIEACGHYVLSTPAFLGKVKRKVRKDIDNVVKQRMIERLTELHGNAPQSLDDRSGWNPI